MDYEIILTTRASESWAEAIRYIAEKSPSAAMNLSADLLKAITRLQTTPLMGAIYERGKSTKIREIQSHPYRIFYRVFKRRRVVEIRLIWHGSRQEPDFL